MNWKKFLLVLGLALVGVWLVIQSGWLGDASSFRERSYDWILANQGFLAVIFIVLSALFIYLIGSPDGRKAVRVRLPEPNAVPFSKAFETLLDAEDEYHDFLYGAYTDYYEPAEAIPVDMAEKGIHMAIFTASDPHLPKGMKRVELLRLASGLIPNPFMENSRLIGRSGYERAFTVHKAKKLGDIAYEELGVSDTKSMINRWAEDHPEIIEHFLQSETQKAIAK